MRYLFLSAVGALLAGKGYAQGNIRAAPTPPPGTTGWTTGPSVPLPSDVPTVVPGSTVPLADQTEETPTDGTMPAYVTTPQPTEKTDGYTEDLSSTQAATEGILSSVKGSKWYMMREGVFDGQGRPLRLFKGSAENVISFEIAESSGENAAANEVDATVTVESTMVFALENVNATHASSTVKSISGGLPSVATMPVEYVLNRVLDGGVLSMRSGVLDVVHEEVGSIRFAQESTMSYRAEMTRDLDTNATASLADTSAMPKVMLAVLPASSEGLRTFEVTVTGPTNIYLFELTLNDSDKTLAVTEKPSVNEGPDNEATELTRNILTSASEIAFTNLGSRDELVITSESLEKELLLYGNVAKPTEGHYDLVPSSYTVDGTPSDVFDKLQSGGADNHFDATVTDGATPAEKRMTFHAANTLTMTVTTAADGTVIEKSMPSATRMMAMQVEVNDAEQTLTQILSNLTSLVFSDGRRNMTLSTEHENLTFVAPTEVFSTEGQAKVESTRRRLQALRPAEAETRASLFRRRLEELGLPAEDAMPLLGLDQQGDQDNQQDGTTDAPTDQPTDAPTDPPTDAPTDPPTNAPTDAPTEAPPTDAPVVTDPAATVGATDGFPTLFPPRPTVLPTLNPSDIPTLPTLFPPIDPSDIPTLIPRPTTMPTRAPSPPADNPLDGLHERCWGDSTKKIFQVIPESLQLAGAAAPNPDDLFHGLIFPVVFEIDQSDQNAFAVGMYAANYSTFTLDPSNLRIDNFNSQSILLDFDEAQWVEANLTNMLQTLKTFDISDDQILVESQAGDKFTLATYTIYHVNNKSFFDGNGTKQTLGDMTIPFTLYHNLPDDGAYAMIMTLVEMHMAMLTISQDGTVQLGNDGNIASSNVGRWASNQRVQAANKLRDLISNMTSVVVTQDGCNVTLVSDTAGNVTLEQAANSFSNLYQVAGVFKNPAYVTLTPQLANATALNLQGGMHYFNTFTFDLNATDSLFKVDGWKRTSNNKISVGQFLIEIELANRVRAAINFVMQYYNAYVEALLSFSGLHLLSYDGKNLAPSLISEVSNGGNISFRIAGMSIDGIDTPAPELVDGQSAFAGALSAIGGESQVTLTVGKTLMNVNIGAPTNATSKVKVQPGLAGSSAQSDFARMAENMLAAATVLKREEDGLYSFCDSTGKSCVYLDVSLLE